MNNYTGRLESGRVGLFAFSKRGQWGAETPFS